eukprot:186408-Rhodomonas_salina.2
MKEKALLKIKETLDSKQAVEAEKEQLLTVKEQLETEKEQLEQQTSALGAQLEADRTRLAEAEATLAQMEAEQERVKGSEAQAAAKAEAMQAEQEELRARVAALETQLQQRQLPVLAAVFLPRRSNPTPPLSPYAAATTLRRRYVPTRCWCSDVGALMRGGVAGAGGAGAECGERRG